MFSFQERTRYHFLLRNCVLWPRFRHPEGRKNKKTALLEFFILSIASQREWSNTLSIVLSWDRMTAIKMNSPRTDKIMDDWTFFRCLIVELSDSISEISRYEGVASQIRPRIQKQWRKTWTSWTLACCQYPCFVVCQERKDTYHTITTVPRLQKTTNMNTRCVQKVTMDYGILEVGNIHVEI